MESWILTGLPVGFRSMAWCVRATFDPDEVNVRRPRSCFSSALVCHIGLVFIIFIDTFSWCLNSKQDNKLICIFLSCSNWSNPESRVKVVGLHKMYKVLLCKFYVLWQKLRDPASFCMYCVHSFPMFADFQQKQTPGVT